MPKEAAPARHKGKQQFARGGYNCKKALRSLKATLAADKFSNIAKSTRARINAEVHPKSKLNKN